MKGDVGVDGEVAGSRGGGARAGEPRAECRHDLSPVRQHVDDGDVGARQPRTHRRDHQSDDAGPNDDDPIAGGRARIPDGVQRGLHVGGQRRPLGWNPVRHRRQHLDGCDERVLVRVETKHHTPGQFVRPFLDDTRRAIAVFDRERERATLERRAHAIVFGRRHGAIQDKTFGAAA